MQLFCEDATILPLKTWNKMLRKVAHNRPIFSVLPSGPKPAQISNIFQRNLPPSDFFIITLVIMLTLVNYTFLLMQLKMCSSTWVVDTYTWEMHKTPLVGQNTNHCSQRGQKVFLTAFFSKLVQSQSRLNREIQSSVVEGVHFTHT